MNRSRDAIGPPPVVRRWSHAYAIVLVMLMLWIVVFLWFSRTFA
jgi:hypothetical protein